MNYKMSAYVLGAAVRVEALFMLIPMLISGRLGEYAAARAFMATAVPMLAISFLLSRKRPEDTAIYARGGFTLVALCWLAFSVCGAFPYYLSGVAPNFVDALFESVSGFTTCGVSVFSDIEAVPRGLLFWRAFTQWIGGMGVLVFILSYLPTAGGHLVHILRAESAGPSVGKMMPKISSHTKALYIAYIALTVLEVLFLAGGGMSVFDSFVHAFATAGTGGFSIKNASIGFYKSAYFEWVFTVFMVLFGTNLMLFYMLVFKRVLGVVKNEELRVYFILMAAGVVLITANLYIFTDFGLWMSLREAVFNTVSFITTTGFVTVDFSIWPGFSQLVLMLLMTVGTCAFSTGGGIKVSRLLILAKSAAREVRRIVHPQSVTIVKLDGRPVEEGVVSAVSAFIMLYAAILIGSTLLLTAAGHELSTAFTAAVSALTTTGPGSNFLGPLENYASFGPFSEIVLMLNMLLGRLEIFPLLILCFPASWTKARAPAKKSGIDR